MKTAAVSTLKAKLSEYLASVKRGEEVIVTERGRPIARLGPIADGVTEDERTARLVARGALRPGKPGIRELIASLRPIHVSEGVVQRVFDEEREDRA
jgi:prevent-host-death family protein